VNPLLCLGFKSTVVSKRTRGVNKKGWVKGFAEALEPNRRKEEMQLTSLIAASIAKLYPEPTQPLSLLHRFLKTKKGESSFLDILYYGRFLITSIVIAKPTAIAIMMAAMPGSKYRSAIDVTACVGTGVTVAEASETPIAVSA
jgi:hypothetical protein